MKKTPNFKVGDKVFAKVKGYPPWPAHIIAENGKKYNVEFYGTGETGVIKVEHLAYYTKNKEKFQRPLKRKDYVDAFEQIEEAIKEDGGDGDVSKEADGSPSSERNVKIPKVSLNTSNTSSNTPPKNVKKSIKRKRSTSEKSIEAPSPPKKKSISPEKLEEAESEVTKGKESRSPVKKPPKSKENTAEARDSKEFEFVPMNDSMESTSGEEATDTTEKGNDKEKSETLDFKIEMVSEKSLKNNITYANYVKEKESLYKTKPVEPREDYISQVLPVKLPSGIMGGIKLHTEWPLKYENEYDRAIYDESVAQRVLEEKQKIDSGNTSIVNNHQLFIPNIEMSADHVAESLYLKDIEAKKAKMNRLKVEAVLIGLDSKIKNCLRLDKANPAQAIGYLDEMCLISFDSLVLKKHPHTVEMVRRLRKYFGNTKEWNLSEESLDEFLNQAEKVREKAEIIYNKLKKVMKIAEGATSFWEGFTDVLTEFRNGCKDMTEAQIFLLCAEPTSRQAFFDHLDEIESEKENSSGVANAESAPRKWWKWNTCCRRLTSFVCVNMWNLCVNNTSIFVFYLSISLLLQFSIRNLIDFL